MFALVAGIHEFIARETEDVDGRDKPGHDLMMLSGTNIFMKKFIYLDYG